MVNKKEKSKNALQTIEQQEPAMEIIEQQEPALDNLIKNYSQLSFIRKVFIICRI